MKSRSMRWSAYGILGVLVFSLVRAITGSSDLTSVGTFNAALLLAIPIALAGLGGLFSERAGVVNIGLEGMMIMGTWAAGFWGYQRGPWMGIVMAVIFGTIAAAVHAVATISFGVDHVVSGVAINLIAPGIVRYLSVIVYQDSNIPGAGPTQSPSVQSIGSNGLPFLSGGHVLGWQSPDLLGSIGAKGWFFISDISRILRGLTGDVSYVTMLCLLLFPLSWYLLWRTKFGLRLRSAGEAPVAAESLGVNVYRVKYIGVLISGALAGLAGGFLAIVASSNYQEGQTGGRGFIGLAAMLFGNWRPGGLLMGSALFGFSDALQLRASDAVHSALLVIAIGFAVYAVAQWRQGRRVGGAVTLALGLGVFALFTYVKELPGPFVTMTPYVTTLVVLSLATQRLRMPAKDGVPYRKGGDS
ncbi:MAG: ABC transporter permease [Candidatus Nanopelagicales bacterium]